MKCTRSRKTEKGRMNLRFNIRGVTRRVEHEHTTGSVEFAAPILVGVFAVGTQTHNELNKTRFRYDRG